MKVPKLVIKGLMVFMLSLSCVIASWGYVDVYEVMEEDLEYMPVLVGCSSNATTIAFSVFFQERGVLVNLRDIRLYLQDGEGKILFQGQLRQQSALLGHKIAECDFDVAAGLVRHGKLAIWAGGPTKISVIYEIRLDVLYNHFKDRKECLAPISIEHNGATSHPIVQYFKTHEFSSEWVPGRIKANR